MGSFAEVEPWPPAAVTHARSKQVSLAGRSPTTFALTHWKM